MSTIGITELSVVFLVALFLLGPKRLQSLIRFSKRLVKKVQDYFKSC